MDKRDRLNEGDKEDKPNKRDRLDKKINWLEEIN